MNNNYFRKYYAFVGVELNVGSGGAKILTDSVNAGGLNDAEVVKIAVGTEGNLTLVSTTDPMPVAAAPSTSLNSNVTTVTTAGTRVQTASNACKSVTVKAKLANTGIIYVGGSGVTSANGFQLAAGDTVSFDISNTNLIYIDSSVNGEGISFVFIN